MMWDSRNREEHEEEGLGDKARKVGIRHMLLGFLILLLLLFGIAWCSMPAQG